MISLDMERQSQRVETLTTNMNELKNQVTTLTKSNQDLVSSLGNVVSILHEMRHRRAQDPYQHLSLATASGVSPAPNNKRTSHDSMSSPSLLDVTLLSTYLLPRRIIRNVPPKSRGTPAVLSLFRPPCQRPLPHFCLPREWQLKHQVYINMVCHRVLQKVQLLSLHLSCLKHWNKSWKHFIATIVLQPQQET